MIMVMMMVVQYNDGCSNLHISRIELVMIMVMMMMMMIVGGGDGTGIHRFKNPQECSKQGKPCSNSNEHLQIFNHQFCPIAMSSQAACKAKQIASACAKPRVCRWWETQDA